MLEKVAINNALPLKATRRDVVAKLKLKSLWGFESELQTNPMSFHLDSLWSATLMLFRASAMDRVWNRILKVGKTPVLL